jgi:pectin methylesterase-like acyl-CoA thioesterase
MRNFEKVRLIRRVLLVISALSMWNASWALSVKSFYPAKATTGQCLDTPLKMVLSGKAVMAWSGSIRIRDLTNAKVVHNWTITTNPGDPQTTAVDASWPWKDSVGHTRRNVWPVVLDDLPEYVAEVRLPQHLLQPNTQYQIEVDGGVLKGSDGTSFDGVPAGAWTFTTVKTRPVSKASIVVAQDNSGDACSIQGGVDLAPSNSKTEVRVLVKPGYYREMVAAKSKNNLHLYGAGISRTFVRYWNSNNLNAGSSIRALMLLGGNGIHIRAMSIINTVNTAGGQAEALYLQGDTDVVADVLLHSYQDTWLNSGGRAYVQDATIEGSVDFIWGYNPVFFKRCTLVMNRTGGVIVQPRNTTTHGYVFDSCTLKAYASGYTGCNFARDGGASYPNGEAKFLHTTIVNGTFLDASPWTIGTDVSESSLGFCEYQSRDQNGNLISITDAQRKRLQCSADTAAQHAKPSFVFGGWTPTVPSLASVLALFGTSSLQRTERQESRGVVLVRKSNGQELTLTNSGVSVVRELRPDGRVRELFRCEGACNREFQPTMGGVSWVEVLQGEQRTVLAVNGATP